MHNQLSASEWDVARGRKSCGQNIRVASSQGGYSAPNFQMGSFLAQDQLHSSLPLSSGLSSAYVAFLYFLYKLFCKICRFGTEAKDEVNLISRLIKPSALVFGPDS